MGEDSFKQVKILGLAEYPAPRVAAVTSGTTHAARSRGGSVPLPGVAVRSRLLAAVLVE
jgi:hypothetical protein